MLAVVNPQIEVFDDLPVFQFLPPVAYRVPPVVGIILPLLNEVKREAKEVMVMQALHLHVDFKGVFQACITIVDQPLGEAVLGLAGVKS